MKEKVAQNTSSEAQKDIQISQTATQNPWLVIGLSTLVLLLLGTTGYFYWRHKQMNQNPSQQEYKLSTTEEPDHTREKINLTGNFYIGPKQFRLVYEYDKFKDGEVPETGTYVLYDYQEKEKYVLREESYNVCALPTIFKSTTAEPNANNVNLLASYYCGDAPQIIHIGISYYDIEYYGHAPKMSIEITDNRKVDLGDSYYAPQKILGFVTLDKVLVSETIRDPKFKQPDKTKYWIVNIDNPSERSEITF